MWLSFFGFFFMWLFSNYISIESYWNYAIASFLVQYVAAYEFKFDFYFDICATYMFWRVVKDNYNEISVRFPRNYQNNIRKTFWVITKILIALDLQFFHREFFMFQYSSITGKPFVVDTSKLKAYDFMKHSFRPRQIFYGDLWVAYWAYILMATHLFSLVVGAILWAMFRPR